MTHITFLGETGGLLVANSSVLTRIFLSGDEVRLQIPRLATIPFNTSPDTVSALVGNADNSAANTDNVDTADADGSRADVADSAQLSILGVCSSASGHQVAALTSDKLACVWRVGESRSCQLLGAWLLPRKASSAVFTPDESALLVADKNSDVYLCDLVELNSARLLFGHLSIILDIAILSCGRYVITCDRDEKVRVTCFPNTHSIHTYCLGHREFVNCVCLLSPSLIATAGGDGVVFVWNALTGHSLSSAPLAASDRTASSPDYRKMAVDNLLLLTLEGRSVEHRTLVAVTQRRLFVFTLRSSDSSSASLSSCSSLEAPGDIITSCSSGYYLLLLLASENHHQVSLYKLAENEQGVGLELETESMRDQTNALSKLAPFSRSCTDTDSLYKHSYDNVSTYLQRKQERTTSQPGPISKRTKFTPAENSNQTHTAG